MAQISTPSRPKSQDPDTQPPAALNTDEKKDQALDGTGPEEGLPIEKTPTSPGAVPIQDPFASSAKSTQATECADEISWVYPGASEQIDQIVPPSAENKTVSSVVEYDQYQTAERLQEPRRKDAGRSTVRSPWKKNRLDQRRQQPLIQLIQLKRCLRSNERHPLT